MPTPKQESCSLTTSERPVELRLKLGDASKKERHGGAFGSSCFRSSSSSAELQASCEAAAPLKASGVDAVGGGAAAGVKEDA